MKFPSLETMVSYGIYTVRDLKLYAANKLNKRKVQIMNECHKCAYVHDHVTCPKCSS